jgi:PKD repeat protein
VSHTVTVTCPPVSDTGFSWTPPTPEAGLPVTFTAAASSTRPLAYAWNLGDGTPASGISVTHVYTPAGDYPVTLTATNDCAAWQAVAQTVTVVPRCEGVSILTITAELSGCVATLDAELTGSEPFTYLWDLGALGTYTEANPVVDFQASGTYSGTLSVWNCGNPEPATRPFSVTVNCRQWLIYLPLVVRGYP